MRRLEKAALSGEGRRGTVTGKREYMGGKVISGAMGEEGSGGTEHGRTEAGYPEARKTGRERNIENTKTDERGGGNVLKEDGPDRVGRP